jgi:hypothetical protein
MYAIVIVGGTAGLSKAETLNFTCGGPARASVRVDTVARKVTFAAGSGLERVVTQFVDGRYGKAIVSGGGLAAALTPPVHQFVRINDRVLEFGSGSDSVVVDRQNGRIIYADGRKGECTLVESKR